MARKPLKKVDNKNTAVVVLAAGEGKRMKSDLPKVLHRVCGSPLISYVLDEVGTLGAGEVLVVVGQGAETVREAVGPDVRCVEQGELGGTGHAVMVALEQVDPRYDELLVLPGDSPLVRGETLRALLDERRGRGAAAAILTAVFDDPGGYGRVIRGGGGVRKIVEETDATVSEKGISEVNACTYAFDRARLEPALKALTTDNAQGEYYLTGVVETFVSEGLKVVPVVGEPEEALGINDRGQLAGVDAIFRERINGALMASGVTLLDPARTYIDRGVVVGRDTVIMPMVFISGETSVGGGCRIGPCTSINDSVVGDGSEIEFSRLDGCEVGGGVKIGPFSRMRPGCRIGDGAKVGSFVDMKNTVLGAGSKVPHLSYVGDAVIGEGVNVGAGSITCNYDGEKKHRTEIGDRAFLGSDTMLIAPVKVGEDAVTGAGSAIYRDVPDGNLGVERSEQENVPDWHEKKKKKGRRAKGGSDCQEVPI